MEATAGCAPVRVGARFAAWAAASCIAALVPSLAGAAPTFHASVVLSPGCLTVDGALRCVSETSSTSTVSAHAGPLTDPPATFLGTQEAHAVAGPGQLKAMSSVDISVVSPFGATSPGFAFNSATAYFTLDDILVSGPAGDTTTISFNIATSGLLTTLFDPTMAASASVNVRYGMNTSFGGFGGASFGAATLSNGSLTASGAFAGGDLSVVGSTVPVMVRAGEMMSFTLILEVGASAGCGAFGCPSASEAFAASDFFHTVEFPAFGPIANLAQGWSISSTAGLIEDNRFVGTVPSPIPVPGTLALVGLALAGMRIGKRKGRLRLNRSKRQVRSSGSGENRQALSLGAPAPHRPAAAP